MKNSTAPAVADILTAAEVQETVDAIVEWQLPSGMIPWFPGGHADPWNHVEAAMALSIGGRVAEAEAAYGWLVDLQRPDGAWHQYYVADGVEDDKFDLNVVAYVAAGVYQHWLITRDHDFVTRLWPVVQRAVDYVLELQQPRGEILWARHADGTPWPFALLTGSSSMCHSIRCAIEIAAVVGEERPDWELAVARLAAAIADHEAEAFAPKHRWAMDWYYPVLGGAVRGEAGRARLAERYDTFVDEGRGVRCVKDRPWITAAETCECVMAHLAVGELDTARKLFGWVQQYRVESGRYWTGTVFPDLSRFPEGEQSTYTAAAVVLAADALAGTGAASGLFTRHDEVFRPLIRLDQADSRD